MDNQNSIDTSEIVSQTKIEMPQCEVVIDENTSSFDDESEIQNDMITYVVIPTDINPNQIIIDYCKGEDEEDSSILTNITELPNQCVLCGETFSNFLLHQEHFSFVHIGNDLTCQICKIQCTTDLQLMRHYNKHKYSCDLCDASFGKYEDLFNHKKTHSQTLPYACNICNEAYSSTKEISIHIRETHSQNKRRFHSENGNKNKKFAIDSVVNKIGVIVKQEET